MGVMKSFHFDLCVVTSAFAFFTVQSRESLVAYFSFISFSVSTVKSIKVFFIESLSKCIVIWSLSVLIPEPYFSNI
jgi:hypothetical protein